MTWIRDSNGLDPHRAAGTSDAVGGRLRLVPHVAGLAHDPAPAGELQHDAVRVLEVEGPDEDSGMQLGSDAQLAVVVVEYRADPDALGLELGPVLQELLFRHVERDVVHRPDRAL